MAREWVEFSCTKFGGGCDGYFRLHLDVEENRNVIVKCPECGHEHQRVFRGGKIAGDRHGKTVDDADVHLIEVPKSAYSKVPMLKDLEEKGFLGSLWARMSG